MVDLLAGRARGVEVAGLGLAPDSWNEGRIVIEARPRPLVDQEVVETRPAQRLLIAHETEEERLVLRLHLPKEERVHDLR